MGSTPAPWLIYTLNLIHSVTGCTPYHKQMGHLPYADYPLPPPPTTFPFPTLNTVYWIAAYTLTTYCTRLSWTGLCHMVFSLWTMILVLLLLTLMFFIAKPSIPFFNYVKSLVVIETVMPRRPPDPQGVNVNQASDWCRCPLMEMKWLIDWRSQHLI